MNSSGLQAGPEEEEPDSDSVKEVKPELDKVQKDESQDATEASNEPEPPKFLRESYNLTENIEDIYNQPPSNKLIGEGKQERPYVAKEMKDLTHILNKASEKGETIRASVPSLEKNVREWKTWDGKGKNRRIINSARYFLLIAGNLVPNYERQRAMHRYMCAETRAREYNLYPGEISN